jgi:hypothetical protein
VQKDELVNSQSLVGQEKKEQTQDGYPRTYRVNAGTRHFLNGFWILLVLFFALMTSLHLYGVIKHPLGPRDLALMDLLVAFGAVWMSMLVNRQVILYEDGIEVAGWFWKRTLRLDEIRGRRMGKTLKRAGASSYYIILPVDKGKRELELPPLLDIDQIFFSWMKSIPEIRASSAKRASK